MLNDSNFAKVQRFIAGLHALVVQVLLLILLFIGAFKLIKSEWP